MLIIMNNSAYCSLPGARVNLNDIIKWTTEYCFSFGLKELRNGQNVLFDADGKSIQYLDECPNRYNPYCASTIKTFEPARTNTNVYAIDSSSARLAETDEGSIYAIKYAIVMSSKRQTLYHYKIGPMMFYLSNETARDPELDHKLANLVLFDHESAQRLARVRIERAIQYELSKIVNNSIILVDGSLRASVFESNQHNLKNIVEYCNINKNSLIGITKKTNLKILRSISIPLAKCRSPVYMDIDHVIKGLIGDSIGNNLLVKFGEAGSPILRVDMVDPEGSKNFALGKLLGNDSINFGYPESLRLAHHISTFSPIEIECIRGHLLSKYRLMEVPTDDIRSTLLGSMSI